MEISIILDNKFQNINLQSINVLLLNSLLMHEWNDDVNSIPTRRNSIKTPYQKSIIILRFRMRLSPIADVDNRHHYDCLRMRVCISHKMR